MKVIKIKKYDDGSHGWFAVKRSLLAEIGIQEKVSGYSYQYGLTCYLEEDCDGTLLLDTLDARGIKYEVEHIYQANTPIRGYSRYICREVA